MDAAELKDLYLRWLNEVWGNGKYEVVNEVFAEDVKDHNSYAGQPAGRAQAGLGGAAGPQRVP